MSGRRGNRPGAKTVIAAEHERTRAFLDRRARGLIDAIADLGDLLYVLLPGIAVPSCFGNGRWKIAPIDDHTAERRDLFAEACDAEGGRPHVYATAAPAHVEWDADEMDRSGHGRTIPVRNRRLGDLLIS